MALADAPTTVRARKTSLQTKLKEARPVFATKEPLKTRQSRCLQLRLQRNPRVSSSAGSKKNVPHSPRLSADPIRGIPNICPDLPCSNRRWVGVGSGAVDGVFYFHAFFPPRRVIAVAHSCRVLATDPCWHSFSQRHVTASQHNSEARVPFRCADWPSAPEARPKRGALIGRRSINSDCHVLIKGAGHNEAL